MPAVPQEVFISYKIGEARSEALRDALTRILQAAPYHLKVISDVGHLGMLEDLQAFMQRLARARYIIVILTPDYLASENCMYELSYMAQSGRLNERVFPIVYSDVTIKDSASRLPYAKRWSDRLRDLKQQVAEMPAREVSKSTRNDLLKLESIVKGTQEALAAIAGMRYMGLAVGESLDAERIAGYVEQWVSVRRKGNEQQRFWRMLIGMPIIALLSMLFVYFLGRWGLLEHLFIPPKGTKGSEAASIKTAVRIPLIADSLRQDSIFSAGLAVLRHKDSLLMDSIKRAKSHGGNKPPTEANPTKGKPSLHPEIQKLLDDMVFVRGGSFMMGSEDTDKEASDDEKPRHEVRLNDYYIGKYEVTQAQWQAVMGDNPSDHTNCPQCPVEQVSWNDCQTFLKKLNALPTGQRFSLPTEAQWEYAARGGQSGKGQNYKYAGGNDLDKVAWHEGNSGGKTHPVGGKNPNALGLYDMSGNVWEWCRDRYDEKYYLKFEDKVAVDPLGPSSGERFVWRGGSWYRVPQYCRVAYRYYSQAVDLSVSVGVRLQRD